MAKNKQDDPQQQLINIQAQQLAAQVANWAAQLEFQKERMRLLELPEMQGKLQVDIDRLAFDKANSTWDQAFKEASLTGTYNGQPTMEWLTQQAQLTGTLNGQQTLTGKLTDAQIADMNNKMALANQQFLSDMTGYFNGQKTFDRQKWEATQATDAWKFIASLTGPSNAFRQARAIGSMPGGLSQMMAAWAGEFAAPGSTSVGSGGQASLAGLMQGFGGNAGGYGPGAYQPGAYQYPGAPGAPGAPGVVGAVGAVGGQGYVDPYAGNGTTPYPGYVAPTPGTPGAPLPIPGIGAPGPNPPPTPTGPIPGRGFTQAQWNPATQAAVAAWNAAHPGWVADGSQIGYHADPTNQGAPATPPATPPAAAPPPPTPTGPIPGRGFTQAQWNPATQAAVAAWNAAHPGWVADGSQVGYHADPTNQGAPVTPPAAAPPPATPPAAAPPPPAPVAPPPTPTGTIPGRGFNYTQWNPATQAAAVTWQAAHPGWILDGSQVGYHLDPAYQSGQPAPTPPATPPAAAPPPVAVAPYSFQPAGVQAPTAQWNYSPTTSGSMWVYPPGTTSPYSTPDISSPYAVSPQAATNMYYYGGAQAPATQTPQPAYDPYNAGTSSDPQNPLLPNQINAQNYNSMYQYQKDLGWAAFEDQGYDKGLAQEAFEKSKPNTGGPLSGHFAF